MNVQHALVHFFLHGHGGCGCRCLGFSHLDTGTRFGLRGRRLGVRLGNGLDHLGRGLTAATGLGQLGCLHGQHLHGVHALHGVDLVARQGVFFLGLVELVRLLLRRHVGFHLGHRAQLFDPTPFLAVFQVFFNITQLLFFFGCKANGLFLAKRIVRNVTAYRTALRFAGHVAQIDVVLCSFLLKRDVVVHLRQIILMITRGHLALHITFAQHLVFFTRQALLVRLVLDGFLAQFGVRLHRLLINLDIRNLAAGFKGLATQAQLFGVFLTHLAHDQGKRHFSEVQLAVVHSQELLVSFDFAKLFGHQRVGLEEPLFFSRAQVHHRKLGDIAAPVAHQAGVELAAQLGQHDGLHERRHVVAAQDGAQVLDDFFRHLGVVNVDLHAFLRGIEQHAQAHGQLLTACRLQITDTTCPVHIAEVVAALFAELGEGGVSGRALRALDRLLKLTDFHVLALAELALGKVAQRRNAGDALQVRADQCSASGVRSQ